MREGKVKSASERSMSLLGPSTFNGRSRLSLTDDQATRLTNAAMRLQDHDREPFLMAVADTLSGRAEVGDGELGRAMR